MLFTSLFVQSLLAQHIGWELQGSGKRCATYDPHTSITFSQSTIGGCRDIAERNGHHWISYKRLTSSNYKCFVAGDECEELVDYNGWDTEKLFDYQSSYDVLEEANSLLNACTRSPTISSPTRLPTTPIPTGNPTRLPTISPSTQQYCIGESEWSFTHGNCTIYPIAHKQYLYTTHVRRIIPSVNSCPRITLSCDAIGNFETCYNIAESNCNQLENCIGFVVRINPNSYISNNIIWYSESCQFPYMQHTSVWNLYFKEEEIDCQIVGTAGNFGPVEAIRACPQCGQCRSVTHSPTRSPVVAPSNAPTTPFPTRIPTFSPVTSTPTSAPSISCPTKQPSKSPTGIPTRPTASPVISLEPTFDPSREPSIYPSPFPSKTPTASPTPQNDCISQREWASNEGVCESYAQLQPTNSPTNSPTTSPTNSRRRLNVDLCGASCLEVIHGYQVPCFVTPAQAGCYGVQPADATLEELCPTECGVTTATTTTTPTTRPTTTTTTRPTTTTTTTPTTTPTTNMPTDIPTGSLPTKTPSDGPSTSPTTSAPTKTPSGSPTTSPTTSAPTKTPSSSLPTFLPSTSPSMAPTINNHEFCHDPTHTGIVVGHDDPVEAFRACPQCGWCRSVSHSPSTSPLRDPSYNPSKVPTRTPTSSSPTKNPSKKPSSSPTPVDWDVTACVNRFPVADYKLEENCDNVVFLLHDLEYCHVQHSPADYTDRDEGFIGWSDIRWNSYSSIKWAEYEAPSYTVCQAEWNALKNTNPIIQFEWEDENENYDVDETRTWVNDVSCAISKGQMSCSCFTSNNDVHAVWNYTHCAYYSETTFVDYDWACLSSSSMWVPVFTYLVALLVSA